MGDNSDFCSILEPWSGFEPETSSLPWMRSTNWAITAYCHWDLIVNYTYLPILRMRSTNIYVSLEELSRYGWTLYIITQLKGYFFVLVFWGRLLILRTTKASVRAQITAFVIYTEARKADNIMRLLPIDKFTRETSPATVAVSSAKEKKTLCNLMRSFDSRFQVTKTSVNSCFILWLYHTLYK